MTDRERQLAATVRRLQDSSERLHMELDQFRHIVRRLWAESRTLSEQLVGQGTEEVGHDE